ncbi:MAG: hypothetical protein WA708_04480 [Acidobacteriaceae bacterium]
MPRDLDTTMAAALPAPLIQPVALALLTFKSATKYVWSGVGDFAYGGNTYAGVGSFGKVGAIAEGSTVHADGTTVTLSGIDSSLLTESLTDVQLGAAAQIWFGLMASGALIGSPYLIFSGTVDKPTVEISGKTMSITLALENKLVNLQRACQRRYTAADQHLAYPDDIGFNWVEILNDIALRWG